MADWWNKMQTGMGDALIGVNNPFGLAPPEGYDRNAAMRQGALSLGMNVLANGSDNPAVALGRGYRQAQALASDNQQNALAAQAMMSAAEEKKQKRQEEADQKAQFENWVKTLPPDQQGLARMFPDKYGAQMVQQQFPDQQGGIDSPEYGLAPVALADKTGKFIGWGQMSKSGGLFYNNQPIDGTGDIVPMAPFDSNQMKAAGTATGREMGGAASAIPGAEIDNQGTNATIDLILNNPNLESAIGYGNALGDYFVSNDVLEIRGQLNKLEGGAFLSAYNTLKGGGQITEIESAQAKQAIADMQTARKISDVNKFKTALEQFRTSVNQGVQKLRKQAGQYAPGASPAGGGGEEQWTIGPDGKPQKVQ